jgi:hypothetical protein
MTNDIVARLRSPEVFIDTGGMFSPVAHEAADEIERLRAALERIAQHDMQAIAVDALRLNPTRTRPAKEASNDAAP